MAPESTFDSQSVAPPSFVRPSRRAVQSTNAVENTRRAEVCCEFVREAHGRPDVGVGRMPLCGEQRSGEEKRYVVMFVSVCVCLLCVFNAVQCIEAFISVRCNTT